MRGNEFLDKMELVDAAFIEEAEKLPVERLKQRKVIRKWGALAACLCLVVAGAGILLSGGNFSGKNIFSKNKNTPVLTWSSGFMAAEYFKYSSYGKGVIGTETMKLFSADYMPPWASERYFSDERESMEAERVIPSLPDYPLYTCIARYDSDDSLFSVTFSWHRQGDTYSHLSIVAGYQEIEEVEDCIFIPIDENGNIVPPAVTVTERDGIQIVAEGKENQQKTLTFQNDTGWYQITGSSFDSYESVVELLDWLWEHPVDFERFSIEKGVEIVTSTLEEHPEAFAEERPDFAAFGYISGANYVQMKDGEPLCFEGHYYNGVDAALIERGDYLLEKGWTEIHWCIDTEPDYYDLQENYGTLEDLSEQQVKEILTERGKISFLFHDCLIKIYSKDGDTVWELLQTLK